MDTNQVNSRLLVMSHAGFLQPFFQNMRLLVGRDFHLYYPPFLFTS